MSQEDFIIKTYCMIDDAFQNQFGSISLRQRGFAPALSDSEMITMEIVAEFLGIDTDKGCWQFFNTHYRHYFPHIGSRANFAKQARNLFAVKHLLQATLGKTLETKRDPLHFCDGFPLPVCHFRRAHFSHIFKAETSFGFCASKNETYYGFKGVLLVNSAGVISGLTVTRAHVDEREALWDVLPDIQGSMIGDKGFIGKGYQTEVYEETGIDLQTAVRANMQEARSAEFITWMKSKRRLIETVIGQLVERFHIQKVRARSLWSLINRTARKILSHTVVCLMNKQIGNPILQFDRIIDY